MERAVKAAGPETASAELTQSRAYRLASWACLFTATATSIAILTTLFLVRTGALGDFSPIRLLHFIPANIAIWRASLLSGSLSMLSFLTFIVAMQMVVDRRLRPFINLAIALSVIATGAALNAQFSMLVLFSDLALQLSRHAGFAYADITHMAWATMNQCVMQSMLIANSLQALVELLLVGCIFFSRNLPSWLAWSALPIALATVNASIFTFLGALQWTMVLTFAALIALVLWTTTLGLMLRLMAKQSVEPKI